MILVDIHQSGAYYTEFLKLFYRIYVGMLPDIWVSNNCVLYLQYYKKDMKYLPPSLVNHINNMLFIFLSLVKLEKLLKYMVKLDEYSKVPM